MTNSDYDRQHISLKDYITLFVVFTSSIGILFNVSILCIYLIITMIQMF